MKIIKKLALFLIAGLVSLALLLSSTAPGSAATAPRAGTYVGQLEGLIDLIGIDVTQVNTKNRRIVRAYLCDGEPGGDARWYSGVMEGNKVRLNSTDGETTLELKLGHEIVTGSVIFADGSVRGFSAPRAIGGGGIYEIDVNPDGTLQGVSLEGDTLIATKSPDIVSHIGDGRPYDVIVTTASGETFRYLYHDLNRMSVTELEHFGFPTSYSTGGVAPVSYTTVWLVGDNPSAPAARGFLCGREGNVKGGQPGTNIFGIWEPA